MSADDPTARPPKRARLSPEKDSSSQPSLSSSGALSLANLQRHSEFRFDDGNVILVTPKHVGFRIFRGPLCAQSTVFAAMFASSSVNADETLDDCPVVQLTDSHQDLAHLFRVLLPTTSIRYQTVSDSECIRTFDELSAVIRLAHKYHIPPIQEQALRALQENHFTSDFSTYFAPQKIGISVHPIQYIGAVNLARLTNTPLMLPPALYICCYIGGRLLDGWTREDGTVEYLFTDDLKLCFDAQVGLAHRQALIMPRLFGAASPDRCTEHGRCVPHITAMTGSPVLTGMVMKEDLLADRSALVRTLRTRRVVCKGCVQALLERERSDRKRAWDSLPQILGITVEGWVKPDGGGTQS